MFQAIRGLIPGWPFWHGVTITLGECGITDGHRPQDLCITDVMHVRNVASSTPPFVHSEAGLIVPDLRAIDCDFFHESSTHSRILLKGLTQSFTMRTDREMVKRGCLHDLW
jgi:hypothetical protein